MTRKKIFFLAIAAVLAVLFIVSAILLFRGITEFRREEARVNNKKTQLHNYYEKKPFPSSENVEIERENVVVAREWFERTFAALRERQIETGDERSPSVFILNLQNKHQEIVDMFSRNKSISIGFERYLAEDMRTPRPAEVPRLTEQLAIIEQLASILSRAGVKTVGKIEREVFESAGAGRGRSRGRGAAKLRNPDAGLVPEGSLYGKYRFVLSFEAKEEELLKTLNALTDHDLFAVVVFLSVEKQKGDVKHPAEIAAAGKNAGEDKGEPPLREDRLVSGLQLEKSMSIRLELDVYKFAEVTDIEA
ncbi:MAG: hypothetical protein ACOC6C_06275 [Verrucomicrobiota bacterium]